MEYLIIFLLVLGIIAVIGHIIWLAVAAIFRALFGKPEQKPVELQARCAKCGRALRITDDFCAVCGHWQKPKAARPLEELAMVARQMDSFLNQGKLDPTTHRRVMKTIEEERKRLANPARNQPTASSTPEPVSAPMNATAPSVAKPQPTAPQPSTALPEPDFSRYGSFSGSRVEAIIGQPAVAAPPQTYVQPEPRRSLTEMLETFMEESSIRWGELIGGLLIIGCSLALVISLWSQIKGEPVLKFSVFIGMTAGLFGMGFYSAHRWKLPTTSRGALIISTLLVPLNFLAMTAFSQSAAPNALIIIGGELLALLLFLFLVYQAGNVIAPGNSWLLAGATLVPSLAMLMAKHGHGIRVGTLFLSLAPMISYWVSTGVMLRGVKGEGGEGESEAERMFALFGVASFASLLPVALLIAKSGNVAAALHTFAPLIALAGIPAIAVGLTLKQSRAGLSGHSQTAATSIAILGAMLAAGGLALAWPRPLVVIGVALINCAICAAIAWRFNLKLAHAAGVAFFALAYLIGANVVAGDFPSWSEDSARLAVTLVSRTSGLAWLTLFVWFGAGAEAWRRFGQKTESRLYEFAAFCSAFISLSLLTWRGFGRAGDPQHLALVYVFYAAAAFAIAWYRNQFVASWVGACLSLLAIVQAFVYEFGDRLAPQHPVRLSLLVYATLATVASVVLRRAGEKAQRIFARPLTYAALLGSVAVAPFVLLGGWMSVGQMSARMLWLAGIWLALSVMKGWPRLFTAFQAALSVGVVCGVAAIFDSRALPLHSSWLDPHLLQAEGIALALLSLTWLLLRIAVRDVDTEPGAVATGWTREDRSPQEPSRYRSRFRTACQRLLSTSWSAVDRVVMVVAWLLLIWLCIGGVTDGMAMRLIPVEQSYVTFHEFALRSHGAGSWLLLLALVLTFVVSLWEEFRKPVVIGLMTLVACACLLLAAGWQGSAWPLSPLNWLFAASFALVALPVIFRQQLQQVCDQFGWPRMKSNADGLASLSRAASIALFAAPALALTAFSSFLHLIDSHVLSHTGMALFLLPLCVLSLTLAAHGVRERSAGYAFAAGLMLNLAVTLGALLSFATLRPILHVNVITSAMVALTWLTFDFVVMRRGQPGGLLRFHRGPACIAIAAMSVAAAIGWVAGLGNERLVWVALCALLAMLIGCLWDGESDLSWRGLHLAGVMLIATALASAHLFSFPLLASTAAVLSLYALVTVLLWHGREGLTRMVDALRIPRRDGVAERMRSWLVKSNILIAAFVTFCSFQAVFDSGSLKVRLLVTTAAFALPLAFAQLAQVQAQMLARGERRQRLIAGSIRLCLLDVLLWSWAWLQYPDQSTSLQLINRLVIVMLIAEAVLIAYRLVAVNQLSAESEWRTAWRDDLWWVAVAGLASLAVVLGVEVSNYAILGSALISGPVILAVLVTLIGLCLIGLAFALLPGEDPFGLDERGRMRYVYAVEGFIVLTLMHVRVTMPWLFGGRFTAYWPLIVLAIAFVGVGLSELFRRQGKLVLAEPLERTGALLPLLPVIGFWAVGSQVSYPMLLLLAGLFYGWLSVIRHSFGFGLLAALAGNAGLWHFLHGEAGYAFSEHPQLWLIPAALSVLLATRINRRDGRNSLSAEQMSSIRYGALITIYVSSTADIFLSGVDDSPWLPIVLAFLSVCGVAVGIMLRIRSFLFLGTAFLLLSMLTMIWSASVNLHWAWLWWVTGIALGVFILYTFAMFERKREEMLRFVSQLKQWQ